MLLEADYSLWAWSDNALGVGGEKSFVFRVGRRLAVATVVISAVVGLMSVASAAPQPGKSCKVAGRERVTSAGTLRCVASSGRSLRWVLVAAPVITTTTTTTTSSTSSTTTTVAVSARAPQVSAVSADDSRVRFTLSGMSPDSGNYAVQWVNKGQSFSNYRMLRVTDKNVSISTAEFACGGSTYTFRVFVMRADWQLSDGHQRQNVTPHTDPFDVAFAHACPAPETTTTAPVTTTTTVPPTCAQGGTCAVGDTGPGGGTVFYVHSDADNMFTSTGSDCGTTCRYLEAAPSPGGDDVSRQWASDNTNRTTAVPAPGARATGIGAGMANTNAIQAQAGNVAASSAAVYAYDYSNSDKTDWHLPSLDELNELCKYARTQATGDTSVVCSSSGSLRSGFHSSDYYWSSTEVSASVARIQRFISGDRTINGGKELNTRVRPIRAFGLPPFSVTYNGNSPSSGSVPTDASTYAFNATVTVAGNSGTLAKTGYTFDGWCTTQPSAGAACGGTSRAAASTFSITSNTTLYAVWTANTLTVTTDEQGGSAVANASTTTGASMNSPGTPTRAGYTFAGWFTASSGGSAITFPYAHGQTANFTLYAQWTANTLTVTTDEQEGSAIDNVTTTTGASMSSPGTPTRTGYVFNGWFTSSTGGTAITFPYAHGRTANFTLYAQWTQTCAAGGACALGDTGPGGGIVFYVQLTDFTSTGSDCGTGCRYLEAATVDQSAGVAWCSSTAATGVTSEDLGAGRSNTTTADSTCTSGAIELAARYTNNGKSDWHLPSRTELTLMFNERARFSFTGTYWSSTEYADVAAWARDLGVGIQYGVNKVNVYKVRAIRAFGPGGIGPS